MTSLKSNDQLVELTYRFCLKRKGKVLAFFGSWSKSLSGQDRSVLVSRLDENSSKITCPLIFQFCVDLARMTGFFHPHFMQLISFYTPRKHQKTIDFKRSVTTWNGFKIEGEKSYEILRNCIIRNYFQKTYYHFSLTLKFFNLSWLPGK